MRVIPVPCRADNYMYIIQDETTSKTAVVDPYDPDKLEAAATENSVKLADYLLTTHHHADHSGGNSEFVKRFPDVQGIAGSHQSEGIAKVVKDGDKFTIGGLNVTAIATPCHTQDHICYYVEDQKTNERAVFTGDTLFVSGCGRFFEGDANQMHTALNVKLAALPDDTVTYVGHEYTKSNVAFSVHVEPENKAIQKLQQYANENEVTTGKFTIGDEKAFNVFMRTTAPDVCAKAGSQDPIKVMQVLREMKNAF